MKDYLGVDHQQYHRKTLATIASISAENGVELVMTFEKSVNTEKFVQYLKRLRQQYPFRPLAIFCDQLAVHKTKTTKEMCEQLKIKMIYNAPYSPDYNPIEGVIGVAKQKIKHRRWNAYQNGEEIDLAKCVNECVTSIEKDKVIKFLNKSKQLLEQLE